MDLNIYPELMYDEDFLKKRIKEQKEYLAKLPARQLPSDMYIAYMTSAMEQKVRFTNQLLFVEDVERVRKRMGLAKRGPHLTTLEAQERESLRTLQGSNRPMFQDQFNRLKHLNQKFADSVGGPHDQEEE